VEDDFLDTARQIMKDAEAKGVKIHLPIDSIIADRFDNAANRQTCESNAIPDGWMGLDVGPKAEKAYHDLLMNSKTILWNGPMGVFEMENFQHGTEAIGRSIAEATAHGCILVGGRWRQRSCGQSISVLRRR
jgi:phosphoglycerate kinase